MQNIELNGVIGRRLALGAAAGLAVGLGFMAAPRAAPEAPKFYTLEVSDVTAKVGEPTVMVVKLKVGDGYRLIHAYNHHINQLSSWDDGVTFADKWVTAKNEDNTLTFNVDVTSTKPGKHPINGVLRFGYIENSESFSMISIPLIANVVGTN